jgi:hypothetical protein
VADGKYLVVTIMGEKAMQKRGSTSLGKMTGIKHGESRFGAEGA